MTSPQRRFDSTKLLGALPGVLGKTICQAAGALRRAPDVARPPIRGGPQAARLALAPKACPAHNGKVQPHETRMTDEQRDPAVAGKTIRFTWTGGPTQGSTHEHVFHDDGTVEWRAVGDGAKQGGAPETPDRPRYSAVPVAERVSLVSYLAASGYTLTVVLNYATSEITGIASSSKEWFPVKGEFEVVG